MNQLIKNKLVSARWFRTGIVGAGVFGIGVAIYLSVKSSPSMSAVHWLPHFITAWADRHGRLCNFPAYSLLAMPFLVLAPDWRRRAILISLLAILIAGLEIVQLWIPTRCSDKWDIFWGWSGLLASWAAFEVIKVRSAGTPNLNVENGITAMKNSEK